MDFKDTPEQAKFRKTCRDWLEKNAQLKTCLLYTSPSPRDAHESRMPSSA